MLEITNLTKRKVGQKKLINLSEAFFKKYKIIKAEVSLVFIADRKSKTLNNTYRSKNKITDVLSFSNSDFKLDKNNFLGEIFINLEEVSRTYKYQEMFQEMNLELFFSKKTKLQQEEYLLSFILIHGLLHLIGFNDDSEKERKKMLSIGYDFLNSYSLKNHC